jgi:Flp pilus assembly pilin Flp
VTITEQRDEGATAVEYAIMVGFIAAVCVSAVTALGISVLALFSSMPAGL